MGVVGEAVEPAVGIVLERVFLEGELAAVTTAVAAAVPAAISQAAVAVVRQPGHAAVVVVAVADLLGQRRARIGIRNRIQLPAILGNAGGVAVAIVGEIGLLERDGIALITHGRYVSAAISATVATAVAIVVPTGDGALRDQVFAIVGIVAVGVDEIGLAADCSREAGAVAVPPAVARRGPLKMRTEVEFSKNSQRRTSSTPSVYRRKSFQNGKCKLPIRSAKHPPDQHNHQADAGQHSQQQARRLGNCDRTAD